MPCEGAALERRRAQARQWYYDQRDRWPPGRYPPNVDREASEWLAGHRDRPEVKAHIKLRQRNYYAANRERLIASSQARVKSDPIARLKHNLRCRLREAIYVAQGRRRGKTASAVRDLGCSIQFFMEYIAARFRDGMSWDNWGRWHLDHIRPLCDFDLTVREQILKACHYSNMQPLWAHENLSKNRYSANEIGGA